MFLVQFLQPPNIMYYVARTASSIKNKGKSLKKLTNFYFIVLLLLLYGFAFFFVYVYVFFILVSFEVEELCGAKRREVVLQLTIAAFSFPAIISSAKAFAENGVVLISHFQFLVDSNFSFFFFLKFCT